MDVGRLHDKEQRTAVHIGEFELPGSVMGVGETMPRKRGSCAGAHRVAGQHECSRAGDLDRAVVAEAIAQQERRHHGPGGVAGADHGDHGAFRHRRLTKIASASAVRTGAAVSSVSARTHSARMSTRIPRSRSTQHRKTRSVSSGVRSR